MVVSPEARPWYTLVLGQALKCVSNGDSRRQRADHRGLIERIAQPKVKVAQQWIGIGGVVYEHRGIQATVHDAKAQVEHAVSGVLMLPERGIIGCDHGKQLGHRAYVAKIESSIAAGFR